MDMDFSKITMKINVVLIHFVIKNQIGMLIFKGFDALTKQPHRSLYERPTDVISSSYVIITKCY